MSRDTPRAPKGADALEHPSPAAEPLAAEPASPSAEAASPSAEPAQRPVETAAEAEPDPLRAELDRVREEAKAHLDDARRIKAEFENYKKRMLKEQTAMLERASEAVVERMLPVLDAFRLALIAADRTSDYDGLVRGVELVYGELSDLLHKEGLEEIDAEGKPFDPSIHEAVLTAEDGTPDGEPFVADVLRTGYRFKGRVLRPAMVKVIRR